MYVDNLKITKVRTDVDYYDSKKDKHIKYKKPKITKKVLLNDESCSFLDLYDHLKHNGEKHHDSIEVSFTLERYY